MDFRSTILVLTSNIGSQFLIDPITDAQAKRESVMAAVRAHFKPEFLNRLDDVVMFDALTLPQLTKIVDMQVAEIERRVADRRMSVTVSDDARRWLAETGFDPVYGARPLRRLVQREIGDRLARLILAGEAVEGSVIAVSAGPDGLIVDVRPV